VEWVLSGNHSVGISRGTVRMTHQRINIYHISSISSIRPTELLIKKDLSPSYYRSSLTTEDTE